MTTKEERKITKLVFEVLDLANKQRKRKGVDGYDILTVYGCALSTIIADSKRPDTSNIDCINTACACLRENLSISLSDREELQPHGDC